MPGVIGLGGSLRAASTSRAALQVTLDGAAAAGAATRLLWVRDLDLPLYTAEHSIPRSARELADTACSCDAMIWSSPTYHGSDHHRIPANPAMAAALAGAAPAGHPGGGQPVRHRPFRR